MKLALLRGVGGVLKGPSAYLMKHPVEQFTDDVAWRMTENFISGE
jgi:myo-inositol-1-phosphate synthase